MDSKHLADIFAKGESALVEFKREWWNLESRLGKAEFSKDVLAMANTLSDGQTGYILIGVEDKKAGGEAIGVLTTPSRETVAQILATYTNPVPRIEFDEGELRGKSVDILQLIWNESHPYYATRDVENVLSSDAVYIRRAGTIGRLKPAEFERLVRAKDARIGQISSSTPLLVGFVELPPPGSLSRIGFSIRNVTEESVSNIYAAIDVVQIVRGRASTCRFGQLHGLNLRPQEVRESEFQLEQVSYWNVEENRFVRFDSSAVRDGATLRLIVRYRERDGFLNEIVKEISIW